MALGCPTGAKAHGDGTGIGAVRRRDAWDESGAGGKCKWWQERGGKCERWRGRVGREWQERGGAWGSAMCSVGAKVGRERRGKCEWRGRGGDFYKTCVGFVGERSALPLWF